MLKSRFALAIIVLTLFLSSTVGYAAENEWKDWGFYSQIQGEGNSKYKAVYLTEEVYEHALPNLADLRLIDSNMHAVPFFIQQGQTLVEENELIYQSELAATKQENNDTIIDFKIEPLRENSDIIGNILLFSLPEENFLKHLNVEGSFDGVNWEPVVRDIIYQTENIQKNEINLDKHYRYTYYRITILDNAEKIKLSGLKLIYREASLTQFKFEKSTRLDYDISVEDRKSVITLNNPQQLKVKEIQLDVEGNFQRAYTLSDFNNRNIAADGSQEIYNLNFQNINISNSKIQFNKKPVSTEMITIAIANLDNPPLNIQDISVIYYLDKIVFEDNGTGSYRLYYGNPQAVRPQYDIDLFQSYIEKEKQDTLSLGIAEPINQLEEIPNKGIFAWLNWKIIFNGVIILISLMLIILLVKKLSKK